MFDNVTWAMVGWVSLYVFVGLLLRTFGPYLVAAYMLIKETNEWRLPKFEPKYVLPPAATLALYVVAVLTIKDALKLMAEMHPTLLITAVYTGQDIFRQAFKALSGK